MFSTETSVKHSADWGKRAIVGVVIIAILGVAAYLVISGKSSKPATAPAQHSALTHDSQRA